MTRISCVIERAIAVQSDVTRFLADFHQREGSPRFSQTSANEKEVSRYFFIRNCNIDTIPGSSVPSQDSRSRPLRVPQDALVINTSSALVVYASLTKPRFPLRRFCAC